MVLRSPKFNSGQKWRPFSQKSANLTFCVIFGRTLVDRTETFPTRFLIIVRPWTGCISHMRSCFGHPEQWKVKKKSIVVKNGGHCQARACSRAHNEVLKFYVIESVSTRFLHFLASNGCNVYVVITCQEFVASIRVKNIDKGPKWWHITSKCAHSAWMGESAVREC